MILCRIVSCFLVSSRKISMANCREVEQLGHSHWLSRHASMARTKCKQSQLKIFSSWPQSCFFRVQATHWACLGSVFTRSAYQLDQISLSMFKVLMPRSLEATRASGAEEVTDTGRRTVDGNPFCQNHSRRCWWSGSSQLLCCLYVALRLLVCLYGILWPLVDAYYNLWHTLHHSIYTQIGRHDCSLQAFCMTQFWDASNIWALTALLFLIRAWDGQGSCRLWPCCSRGGRDPRWWQGTGSVDFIVGYLWILVESSCATSRLELHGWSSNVRVPYRAPNARALWRLGFASPSQRMGEPLHSSYARHVDFAILGTSFWHAMMCHGMTWCDSSDLMWYDAIWCHLMSFDVLWCDVIWCDLFGHNVSWCYVIWCHMTWCDGIELIGYDAIRHGMM